MKIYEITENVGTALKVASNVASAGKLGARAGGQNKAGDTLDTLSKVAGSASDIAQIVAGTAGPLMIASSVLDVVRAIATTDEDFVDKIKNAKAQAEVTKKPVKFTHPANLPGPLKIASHLADLFGGKLEGTYVVTPKGELKYDPSLEEKETAVKLWRMGDEAGKDKFSGTGGLY